MHPVVIAGAGLIGLSIALELHRRRIAVSVLEAGSALRQASFAAAGMLAAEDPHNPPELLALARYSLSLYPEFLARIEALSGMRVPVQTNFTVQHPPNAQTLHLDEPSIDPCQLAAALLVAVRAAGIDLREHQPLPDATRSDPAHFLGETLLDKKLLDEKPVSRTLVLALGAWSGTPLHPVVPRKGQMLRVALPPSLHDLREVHRSEHVYIVPRTQGPQAGSALIGATVEDAGFDTTVHTADLAHLRSLAAKLLPALASEADAPTLESWAGLRPATPDGLPLLGKLAHTCGDTFLATGHFRNGILLAPATAAILADLIEGKPPAVGISAFAPQRFQLQPAPCSSRAADIRSARHDNRSDQVR